MERNDIVRIYICGPHSTGKTTLLNDLQPHLKGFKNIDEVARDIIKLHNWKREDFLPGNHPEIFQQLNEEIITKQIEIERNNSDEGVDFICDRALDPIVYCNFYIGKTARDAILNLTGMDNWLSSLRRSLVFLISPHPECIAEDNIRLSSTIEELRQFHSAFEKELLDSDISFCKITELDREKRVQQVLLELETFKHNRIASLQ